MRYHLFLLFTIGTFSCFASNSDTLMIESEYLNETREVYVIKPEFFKYQSEDVKIPIIYILDGQHEWFVNPTLNTLKYLQYTHQIPQSLIVVIPLKDRYKECAIDTIEKELPLSSFIAEELDLRIVNEYHTSGHRTIIGHSFSASFALLSYYHQPGLYSAIIAHSPMDKLEDFCQAFDGEDYNLDHIYISVGGKHQSKDFYHRDHYDLLKNRYPDFFSDIHTYEAENAAHTAVPIVANPSFLCDVFYDWSIRMSNIARVDMNYELIEPPLSVNTEIYEMHQNLRLNGYVISPQIPEINGIASRYLANDYKEYARAVYLVGTQLYPLNYEFQWYVGELFMESDTITALRYLEESKRLLKEMEPENEESESAMKEIETLIEQCKSENK